MNEKALPLIRPAPAPGRECQAANHPGAGQEARHPAACLGPGKPAASRPGHRSSTGGDGFIEKFKWMIAVLKDYDACRRIAYENVEDAREEGLAYVELRFSPVFMASSGQLDPAGIVEAVCDGVAAGRRDFKQPVNLIGIISRTYGPEAAWKELEALLTQKGSICRSRPGG